MATEGDRPSTSTTKLRRSSETNLRNSATYNFRLQSAPPLSLRQYLRSATGVLAGCKDWQTSGRYRPPPFRAYLSPAVKVQVKPPEPVWRVTGPYKEQRPTSLSPETRPQKITKLPAWQPPGRVKNEPVPYFDPPNLRWSLQELLRSMPEMQAKTLQSSRSFSSMRKSVDVPKTDIE